MSAADLIKRFQAADVRGIRSEDAAQIVVEWLRDEATDRAQVADEIATTRQAGDYFRAGAETLERLSRELHTEVLHA